MATAWAEQLELLFVEQADSPDQLFTFFAVKLSKVSAEQSVADFAEQLDWEEETAAVSWLFTGGQHGSSFQVP